MKLDKTDAGIRKKIDSFLENHKGITYSTHAVGEFNSVNVFYSKGLNDFKRTLLDFRNNFSDSLGDFSSLIISKIEQHTYYPEGFLE